MTHFKGSNASLSILPLTLPELPSFIARPERSIEQSLEGPRPTLLPPQGCLFETRWVTSVCRYASAARGAKSLG